MCMCRYMCNIHCIELPFSIFYGFSFFTDVNISLATDVYLYFYYLINYLHNRSHFKFQYTVLPYFTMSLYTTIAE